MLFPGQFVTIRVVGYVRTDAILVPQRAVQHGTKGSFVYVVSEDKKIELRDVQTTFWHGNQGLIEEGLHAGERVVVEGLQQLRPGAEVNPVPFRDESPSAVSQSADENKEEDQ